MKVPGWLQTALIAPSPTNRFASYLGGNSKRIVNGVKDHVSGVWDDVTGVTAANKAAEAQLNAADKADANLRAGYEDARELQQPYLQGGAQDYGRLRDLVASGAFDVSGAEYSPGPSFRPEGFNLEADPGYQFRMEQGTNAVQRAASARNGGLGGSTLKELTRFGQGLGSDEADRAYGRFDRDRTAFDTDRAFRYGAFADNYARRSGEASNRFGRLAGLAEVGPRTANSLGNQRLGLSGTLGDLSLQSGNARAAGIATGYNNQRDTALGIGGIVARYLGGK